MNNWIGIEVPLNFQTVNMWDWDEWIEYEVWGEKPRQTFPVCAGESYEGEQQQVPDPDLRDHGKPENFLAKILEILRYLKFPSSSF